MNTIDEKFKALSEGDSYDYRGNDMPKCPHCGVHCDVSDNGWLRLYEEGEHKVACPECDGDFTVHTHVRYYFNTDEQERTDMNTTERLLAEALRRLINTFPIPVDGVEQADRASLRLSLLTAREALASWEAERAAEATADAARLTDEQRIDWLCEEAVYHCGQWQVVFDSDKDSFIDAIDEMAAIAHGIDASEGEDKP